MVGGLEHAHFRPCRDVLGRVTAKWSAVEGVGMGLGLTNVVKSVPEPEFVDITCKTPLVYYLVYITTVCPTPHSSL
jgi:hypothetical protein